MEDVDMYEDDTVKCDKERLKELLRSVELGEKSVDEALEELCDEDEDLHDDLEDEDLEDDTLEDEDDEMPEDYDDYTSGIDADDDVRSGVMESINRMTELLTELKRYYD